MNSSDFQRPIGVEEGILLNSNTQALTAYKKAKKRLSSVTVLEDRVKELEENYSKLIKALGIIENG